MNTKINIETLEFKTVNHPDIKHMEITKDGILRRKDGVWKKHLRTGTIDNNGYRSINLGRKDEKGKRVTKKYLIHRLIALTYLPDTYFEGAVVNHISGNKLENNVENLEWISHKENIQKHNLLNPRNTFAASKLTDKEIKISKDLYKSGTSIWDIWETVLNKKVNYSTVLNMVHNKTHKHIN